MNSNLFVVIAASAIFYGTPLYFAALGEVLTERSGVLNLGVEGMMLVGAVVAATTCLHAPGPGWLVLVASILAMRNCFLVLASLAAAKRAAS